MQLIPDKAAAALRFGTKLSTAILIVTCWLLPPALQSARADSIMVPMDPWPPWKFVDVDSWKVDPNGIDNQLIEALISAYDTEHGTTTTIEYRGFPWKRCLQMMRTGEADLISGIFKRPEREDYLHFIEPPYKTRSAKVFYVRKGSGHTLQAYEDLLKLKIGVQAGVKYFQRFDADRDLIKEEAGGDLYNFRKLAYGRLDAVISTETNADYLIAIHGLQDQVEKAPYRYDDELPVYFAISKQSPLAAQVPRFSRIVKQLKEKHVFRNIIHEYLSDLAPTIDIQRQNR